jgi:hypothetical protein
MAVQVRIVDIHNGIDRSQQAELDERHRRLLQTTRRRRLARIRRTAETAAWIVGSTLLALIAIGGLAGLR